MKELELGYLKEGQRFYLSDDEWEIINLDLSGSASGGPHCKRIKDGLEKSFWCGTFVKIKSF